MTWENLDETARLFTVLGAAAVGIPAAYYAIKKVWQIIADIQRKVQWIMSDASDHEIINQKLEEQGIALTEHGLMLLEIASQFKPNGGTNHYHKVERLMEMMSFQSSFFHATLDTNKEAHFRTDEKGGVVWCNRAFSRLMGVTPAEVMDFGWVNIIDRTESGYRDKVVTMWLHAVKNQREFNEIIKYRRGNGTTFKAHVLAFVIRSDHGMFGHFGEILPLPIKIHEAEDQKDVVQSDSIIPNNTITSAQTVRIADAKA